MGTTFHHLVAFTRDTAPSSLIAQVEPKRMAFPERNFKDLTFQEASNMNACVCTRQLKLQVREL